MAIPGVNFTEEEGKVLKDLVRSLKESTDSAKHTYEGFQKTLHGIEGRLETDSKQRLADFKIFTKEGQKRILKENERTDALLKELKDSHRLMSNIQQDSKAMRQVILSMDVHRYLKKAGGELSKTYGDEKRKLVDRNTGAAFLDHFLKKLPLAQMLSKRYVGAPGSHDKVFEDQKKKLLGVAERDVGDILHGALLEGNLGVGQGDKYTDSLKEIAEGNSRRTREVTNWKKRSQRDERGRFTVGNTIGRKEEEIPYAGGQNIRGGRNSERESVGTGGGNGKEDSTKVAWEKSPLHPTAAFVSNLPAAYGAGSLLIYDLLKDPDQQKKEKGIPSGGGGGLLGAIGSLIPALGGLVAVLGPIALVLGATSVGAKKVMADMQKPVGQDEGADITKAANAATFSQLLMRGAVPDAKSDRYLGKPSKAGGGVIPETGLVNMHKGEIVLPPNESAQFSSNLQKLVADSSKSKDEPISTATLEALIEKLHVDLVAEMKKNNELTQKGVDLAGQEPDNRKPIDSPSRQYVSTP